MYRRWGQAAPDAEPYSSYTEEEFHRALERWKKVVSQKYSCSLNAWTFASEADPGPQLQKVIDFRKHLEETRKILYHYFEDEESFVAELDAHLRAFAKGDLPEAKKQKTL
ncbi:MAG: hypothetical protein H6992_12260 [Pseudomonadales bacterium]|nr:hypothetical protein [Pseudomonadales bacterium]